MSQRLLRIIMEVAGPHKLVIKTKGSVHRAVRELRYVSPVHNPGLGFSKDRSCSCLTSLSPYACLLMAERVPSIQIAMNHEVVWQGGNRR
jgi:hypothetical protein